jgi:ferrous iron transport protein A
MDVNIVTSGQALSSMPTGQRGMVLSLEGGRIFCSRAANLGFTEGAEVTIVQNYGRGPLLVSLRGTLVALGRAEAAKVLINAAKDQDR